MLADLDAAGSRRGGHCPEGRFDLKETGTCTVAGLPVVADLELRPALSDFVRVQPLEGDVVLHGAGAGSLGMIAADPGRELDRADAMEHLDAGFGFEFLPEFVRVKHQGDVTGTLGVSMPDHTSLAAVGAVGVNVAKLFKDQRALAAFAEFPGGGSTHRTAAEDDDRVVGHRANSVTSGTRRDSSRR